MAAGKAKINHGVDGSVTVNESVSITGGGAVIEKYKSASRATNESPAIATNQCLGRYADKLLIISN
ncbi:MAG: hypothetical protein F4246_11050 [Rhodothermaceae bacterium]|nr:hypothetical protein [Rhodothermaceae bacterium]MYI43767.1 hypothetical protein [Rhodothermaceae bacterium]